jgi:hypothetical protein
MTLGNRKKRKNIKIWWNQKASRTKRSNPNSTERGISLVDPGNLGNLGNLP